MKTVPKSVEKPVQETAVIPVLKTVTRQTVPEIVNSQNVTATAVKTVLKNATRQTVANRPVTRPIVTATPNKPVIRQAAPVILDRPAATNKPLKRPKAFKGSDYLKNSSLIKNRIENFEHQYLENPYIPDIYSQNLSKFSLIFYIIPLFLNAWDGTTNKKALIILLLSKKRNSNFQEFWPPNINWLIFYT